MMDLIGRWITRNKTLVVVHLNKAALPGNREKTWIGHTIARVITDVSMPQELKICWNENGECVWVQGIVDDTKNYDIMDRVSGKDKAEATMKVVGCKECEK